MSEGTYYDQKYKKKKYIYINIHNCRYNMNYKYV